MAERLLAEVEVIISNNSTEELLERSERLILQALDGVSFVVREVHLNGSELYVRASGLVPSPAAGVEAGRRVRRVALQLDPSPTVRAKWWKPTPGRG